MDALVELLPILFVVAYYLLAARRRSQQKKQAQIERAPQEQLVTQTAEAPATPFRSFLQNLEEAMAEANNATSPPPPLPLSPPPVEPVSLPPPVRAGDTEFHAAVGSFDNPLTVGHQTHGFGPDNPLSEEVFEQQPAFQKSSRTETPSYDPHRLRTARQPSAATGWRQRLADPEAARDAFVLQTVFGKRGGRGAEQR